MDNMQIYNAGRAVPAEAQKQFSNGKFSGTDINPMWRIKKLTELFGPAGVGWYVDNVVERCEEHGETTMAIVNLELYIKVDGEWSKPIYGTGGNVLLNKGRASDEGYKMAFTDALSIACKSLGIGADIWFANDTTKYTRKNDDDLPFTMDEKKQPEKFECELCHKVITPWIGKDGKTKMSVREIAQNSTKEYGQPLCLDCIRKHYPDGMKA